MANCIEHPANLLIPAFEQSHFEPGVGVTLPQPAYFSASSPLVFANPDTTAQALNGLVRGHAFYFRLIDLRDLVPRGSNDICQFAVIRQQQQSFSVEVQPPDGMHPAEGLGD